MLPQLQAEDALQRVQEHQAADSWLEADTRRRLIEVWQEQAGALDAQQPRSREEYAQAAAMLGMTFIEE
ncbi:MAG TPA: hypothetical protein VLL76_09110 [Candidatus Omnitrophota bacterium]|nr:hypothetical protein [Candidatus Omnitrophota bacterium]